MADQPAKSKRTTPKGTSNGSGKGTPEPTVADLLARKRPHQRSVTVLLDQDTGERLTFTFRAVPRSEWDDLVAAEEHQPTEEQKAEFLEGLIKAGVDPAKAEPLSYNPETFAPAAVAASCIEPKLTLEDVLAMWESPDWSAAELARVFQTAMWVNQRADGTVFWGKGSGSTPD